MPLCRGRASLLTIEIKQSITCVSGNGKTEWQKSKKARRSRQLKPKGNQLKKQLKPRSRQLKIKNTSTEVSKKTKKNLQYKKRSRIQTSNNRQSRTHSQNMNLPRRSTRMTRSRKNARPIHKRNLTRNLNLFRNRHRPQKHTILNPTQQTHRKAKIEALRAVLKQRTMLNSQTRNQQSISHVMANMVAMP